jgi:hypothetical protein
MVFQRKLKIIHFSNFESTEDEVSLLHHGKKGAALLFAKLDDYSILFVKQLHEKTWSKRENR